LSLIPLFFICFIAIDANFAINNKMSCSKQTETSEHQVFDNLHLDQPATSVKTRPPPVTKLFKEKPAAVKHSGTSS